MVVLRSVQAENITSCNGVIHLPAGHHTLVVRNLSWSPGEDCGDCQIVGEPGAVLDTPVACIGGKGGDGRRMRGHLTLNGSLVVQGHRQSLLYGDDVAVSGGLLIHGNISIKDCGIVTSYPVSGYEAGRPLEIVGPQSGENMVSITNSSLSIVPFVTISNGARVTFSDFSYVADRDPNNLDIRNSSVIFERGSIWALHNHYLFQDSTIIASNTSFGSGDGHFIASNSVLNFTNSTVNLGNTLNHGYQGGSIDISNCSVDVTCGSDPYSIEGPVFSSTGGSMAINDSIVRFAQCSCHLDQAISLSRPNVRLGQDHTLSFRKSSVTFSMCQANRASSKADPVVVVV